MRLDVAFQPLAILLIGCESGLVVIDLAQVGFELSLDLGNVFRERGDFPHQFRGLVIENLKTNRVLNVNTARSVGLSVWGTATIPTTLLRLQYGDVVLNTSGQPGW